MIIKHENPEHESLLPEDALYDFVFNGGDDFYNDDEEVSDGEEALVSGGAPDNGEGSVVAGASVDAGAVDGVDGSVDGGNSDGGEASDGDEFSDGEESSDAGLGSDGGESSDGGEASVDGGDSDNGGDSDGEEASEIRNNSGAKADGDDGDGGSVEEKKKKNVENGEEDGIGGNAKDEKDGENPDKGGAEEEGVKNDGAEGDNDDAEKDEETSSEEDEEPDDVEDGDKDDAVNPYVPDYGEGDTNTSEPGNGGNMRDGGDCVGNGQPQANNDEPILQLLQVHNLPLLRFIVRLDNPVEPSSIELDLHIPLEEAMHMNSGMADDEDDGMGLDPVDLDTIMQHNNFLPDLSQIDNEVQVINLLLPPGQEVSSCVHIGNYAYYISPHHYLHSILQIINIINQ